MDALALTRLLKLEASDLCERPWLKMSGRATKTASSKPLQRVEASTSLVAEDRRKGSAGAVEVSDRAGESGWAFAEPDQGYLKMQPCKPGQTRRSSLVTQAPGPTLTPCQRMQDRPDSCVDHP